MPAFDEPNRIVNRATGTEAQIHAETKRRFT